MQAHAEHFLNDKHLRYMGWCLNDRDSSVRKAVLDNLFNIYDDDENLSALSKFTDRFRARMKEMLNDIDPQVVASAIQTLTRIFEQG